MKNLKTLVLIIACVTLISGCSSVEQKKTDSASSTTTSTTSIKNESSQNTTQKAKTYTIGDTVALKNFNFTVNSIRKDTGTNDFDKPEDGKEYFYVDCTIENISDKDQVVSSMLMFKVVNKDGRELEQSFMGKCNGNLDGNVGIGRKITGEYCVEIPKNQTGLELQFDSSMVNSQQIVYNLN